MPSAVLPDGGVVVEGGEFNGSGAGETALGAIYNPATDAWTAIAPPSGVYQIGDAASVVLPDGTFMLGPCCSSRMDYLLNPYSLTWTATGSVGKADNNDEEGWTLLPNGKVLTIDTKNGTNSELYNPFTGGWTSAGSTGVVLPAGLPAHVPEVGPAVLRPDGTVFATGGTSNIAVYDTASGTWSSPTFFPDPDDVADGPAALLPNGKVLVDTSRGIFLTPSHFYEFDGASVNPVAGPQGAAQSTSFLGRMLVLPTGQILFTDVLNSVQLYTASGTYQNSWRPTITSVPSAVTAGVTGYSLSGTQLNGLSQGAMYGDDAQSATNYPLVRITNDATHHVVYAKTHNHSSMGVATGSAIVSTQFDVPAGIETGASQLEVVANGIPSAAVNLQVLLPISYLGTLEHAGCDTLSGWAADQGRLNTSIYVSIYDNGTLLTTVPASNYRSDVAGLLGDNGLHGFSIATPNALKTGTAHTVGVRFEGSGTNLAASPVSLTCAPPPPPPVAGFSYTCSGLTCSFDGGASTGSGLTYGWTFGDSGSGSGIATSHTYAATGTYTVTLTVTDSLARQSSSSKKLNTTSDSVAPAESYFAVAPCRILDTRNTTILTNNVPRVVSIAGLCGIPSTAKAVSFNVTAISSTGSGKIALYPGNLTTAWTGAKSSLNFAPASSPRANSAVVQLATDGTGTLGINAVVADSPGAGPSDPRRPGVLQHRYNRGLGSGRTVGFPEPADLPHRRHAFRLAAGIRHPARLHRPRSLRPAGGLGGRLAARRRPGPDHRRPDRALREQHRHPRRPRRSISRAGSPACATALGSISPPSRRTSQPCSPRPRVRPCTPTSTSTATSSRTPRSSTTPLPRAVRSTPRTRPWVDPPC